MEQGFFITFEGGEGSGKTTQINKLAASLAAQDHKVATTREPGGTPEADVIRSLIVQKDGGDWTPMAEVLLLNAGRAQHVAQMITPALEEGKVVVCDRFTDSTLAYQGYGHGIDLDILRELNGYGAGEVVPDLTILLDIDPKDGIERTKRRGAAQALDVEQMEDRFENLDMSFHEAVRQGFLEIAAAEPKRFVVLDAAQDVDELAADILQHVTKAMDKA